MAKSAGGQGFGRVTSQQAEVQVGAALVHAVSEAIVTQAFKSAVQENGLQKFEIDRDAWLHSKKSTQNCNYTQVLFLVTESTVGQK